MKRKVFMMGFAMMAGLPHAVCAKGGGKENLAQSYSSWNGAYMPHYGAEGLEHPLMDICMSRLLPVRTLSQTNGGWS